MGGEHHAGAVVHQLLDGGQRGADAGVVRNGQRLLVLGEEAEKGKGEKKNKGMCASPRRMHDKELGKGQHSGAVPAGVTPARQQPNTSIWRATHCKGGIGAPPMASQTSAKPARPPPGSPVGLKRTCGTFRSARTNTTLPSRSALLRSATFFFTILPLDATR